MHRRLTIVLAALALACSCAKKPDTLVTGGYDQEEMDAAIARARAEVDDFLVALKEGSAESFAVKAPITDSGETEHFWISDVRFENGTFVGVIGNEPGLVRNVQFGQEWRVKKEEITDWMYVRGEKIHGGYTIDPLLSTFPADQAKEYKQRLVR